MITCSNFGVMLVERCLGLPQALELANRLTVVPNITTLLDQFRLTDHWQYSPDRETITRINQHEQDRSEDETADAAVIRSEDHV
jgi:hypothetical protein